MENALNATNALHLRVLRKPNIVDMPPGPVAPPDLPLALPSENAKPRHIFDLIGPIDFPLALKEQVTQACKDSRFHDLPPPFRLKISPEMPFEFQLAAVPMQDDNKWYLLKHIALPEQVKVDFAKDLCFGSCHILEWKGNAKNVKKAFQHMFLNMGGFQVQAYTLHASCGAPAAEDKPSNFHQNLTEESIEAGFDYIEAHGPRTHHANTQLKWITKQFISEESPIKQWPERLIKEALRNLMNDGVLALPVHDFPLTLVDVEPAVLLILENLFPYFTDKALGMHGVPNVGKTPLGRIIAMAMSRYWVHKLGSKNPPGFREASEFDFFRGEAGRRDRPDLFDDGSLPEQPMRKLKGFCDVGNTVLTKERWGAAKFPQGQMRLYMVNDLDVSAEPKQVSGMTSISHKEFMEILEPAWMKGSTVSDVNAVLKRTCILIITNQFLYWRLATEAEVRVERMPLDSNMSLLRQSGGEKYMRYRKGERTLPDDFELHARWEQAWMKSIMENQGRDMPPLPVEIVNWRSPFSSDVPTARLQVQDPVAKARIKQEPHGFKRLLSNAPGLTIDLDSPPKKRHPPVKVEPASSSVHAPVACGTIDLLSDEEHANPMPTNPILNIEGMEEQEEDDVFGHGMDLGENE